MAKLAGCEGKVVVDGTRVDVTDWTFDDETTFEDVTDTGTNCFEDELATFRTGNGSFNLIWDSAKKPTANPPNLNSGVQVTNLELFLGDTSDKVLLPLANIKKVTISSEVKGVVKFNCEFKNSGTFTMPS